MTGTTQVDIGMAAAATGPPGPGVVHVAGSDSGGAGHAAYLLHCALRGLAVDSTMLVATRRWNDDSIRIHPWATSRLGWVRLRLRRLALAMRECRELPRLGRRAFYSLTDERAPYGAALLRALPATGIVNIHHAPTFLDWTACFPRLGVRRPLVMTLHDQHPITGGCRYAGGCQRFVERCGGCPVIRSKRDHDLSRRIWLGRHTALSRMGPEDLQVVSPSHWLAQEARRSSILGRFPIEVIPYGVDTDQFIPRPSNQARELLGLDPAEPTVLFVASHITDPRKGLRFLIEALARLDSRGRPCLVTVGSGTLPGGQPFRHIALGELQDRNRLAYAYAAADVFALPSLEDNLPNTMLESLACGIPIVGFGVGGIPDFVREGETGFVASAEDAAGLAVHLGRVLSDRSLWRRLSARCREVALEELTLERQARRYAALYRGLLAARQRRLAGCPARG